LIVRLVFSNFIFALYVSFKYSIIPFLFMKKKAQINYQVFFFMGLTFVGTGVVFIAAVNSGLGVAFMGLGIVWMIIGWTNKDKWKK